MIQDAWYAKQKFILLAIDVPKGNEQSPKAVESFFTYLAGAHSNLNLVDEYVDGKFQLSFSCEVISIGGYTQFIVRTPVDFRQLVEAGLYAQYPDAEITEIQDYTTGFPRVYPNSEFDVWGAEFVPVKDGLDVLPIKVYKEFEHNLGKPEFHFRDPIASLMDLCSSLRQGENLWFQILVQPTDTEWTKKAPAAINKILGVKPKTKPMFLFHVLDYIADTLGHLLMIPFNIKSEPAKESAPLKMMDLNPQQKKQVEAIQDKAGKLGFKCKVRVVYIANKEVMVKPKVVNGFVGFIKQFGDNDLMSLKPDGSKTGTSTAYFMKDSRLSGRKGRIVRNYMSRSVGSGRPSFIMNVEELATLWHFPLESVVKAPLIQKTPGKKAEPPTSLPIGEELSSSASFMDEIFVVDQPTSRPSPMYKQEENIFDLSFDSDVQETSSAQKSQDEAFVDIFVDSERLKPEAPKTTPPSAPVDRGAPPSNLPFA